MDHKPEDWQRLADHIVKRRTELGLTQQDVRAQGGPSTATMRLLEGALQTSYQPVIIGRLERALRWQSGSVYGILAGRKPINYHDASDGDETPAVDEAQAVARVRATAHDATVRSYSRVVDFGLGEELPYPEPKDDTELEANETWLAAKNLERIMRRQREREWERLRRSGIDEAG